MVPLAVSGIPIPGLTDDKPSAPELHTQPLAGVGGGQTVRKSAGPPFSLVALTASDFTSARVRPEGRRILGPLVRGRGARWCRRGARATTRGTEPVFVGRTKTVQIAVTRPAEAAATPPAGDRPQGPGLGYRPVDVRLSLGASMKQCSSVRRRLRPMCRTGDRGVGAEPATQHHQPGPVGAPTSVRAADSRSMTRACAPPSCTTPPAATTTRPGFRGHRPVYEYHTRELGWCDIAYNLVDKYGQVFEAGSAAWARPVEHRAPADSTSTPGVWRARRLRRRAPDPAAAEDDRRNLVIGWRLSLDTSALSAAWC